MQKMQQDLAYGFTDAPDDLAAEREGTYGLLARHLIEYLPQAMRKGEES